MFSAGDHEDDVYGTAFAPPLSPEKGDDLTNSGVQRVVEHQLEKYNVSIPADLEGEPIGFGGPQNLTSSALSPMSMPPPSLNEVTAHPVRQSLLICCRFLFWILIFPSMGRPIVMFP